MNRSVSLALLVFLETQGSAMAQAPETRPDWLPAGAYMADDPALEVKAKATAIQADYPPESLRAGEVGTVRLRYCVDKHGAPQSVVLIESSGFKRLDNAALQMIRKAKFSPGQSGGAPVMVCKYLRQEWRTPARVPAPPKP